MSMYDTVNMRGLSLMKDIASSTSISDVLDIHSKLQLFIKELVDVDNAPRYTTQITSYVSDALIRKVIAMAINEMNEPPVKFAFVLIGSEARREETMISDQDNLIIYEDSQDKDQVVSYFAELAEKICCNLDRVGYRFCDGNNMASNPKWCQSLSQWKKYFDEWTQESTPEDLLKVNIFFDLRALYGEGKLLQELLTHRDICLKNKPIFFIHSVENALLYKTPMNLFGHIRVGEDKEHPFSFNIKKAMKPIVNFARIYALKYHVKELNTLNRVDELYAQRLINQNSHKNITHAYSCLMSLRLKNQIQELTEHIPLDNYVNPKKLTKTECNELKKSLNQIHTLQNKLSYDFRGISL